VLTRDVVTCQVLSNTVKQKRKEKAGKWSVPLPKVKPVADDEMFKVMHSGKRKGQYATGFFAANLVCSTRLLGVPYQRLRHPCMEHHVT
jgi:hypothetical protein